MSARIGVVTFPGSLDDVDAARAVRIAGAEPVALWHGDDDLAGVDAVVLPGGFSYGDYLRAGAIARFSPVMREVVDAARGGLPVLGICNGFQVLCEAAPAARRADPQRRPALRLPGPAAAGRNDPDRLDRRLQAGQEIVVPVKHGEGRYVADPGTLAELEAERRVVFRYAGGNPNGSLRDIAGVCAASARVVGLMPHPEHAVDGLTGPSVDGVALFLSVLTARV